MIKLFYDSNGVILDAFDGVIPTPEKYSSYGCLQVSDEAWKTAEGMNNKVVDGQLVSMPDFNAELKAYSDAVQAHLDSVARARGYDNCYTCLSYLNSTNETWRTESNIYNGWRDNCWLKCHEVLTQWQTGQITQPTIEQLISQLPKIEW